MNRSRIIRAQPGADLEALGVAAAAAILRSDIVGAGAGRHADLEVYRPGGMQFSVELLARLVSRSVLAPVAGPARVVVVLEPERMTEAAANLLLKTLEEPPPSLHILLVTSHYLDLPETIRSRCAVDDAALEAHGTGGLPDEAADVWATLPARLTQVPGECLRLPDEIEALLAPLPALGEDDARRSARRARTDQLMAGLGVLAETYRAALRHELAGGGDGAGLLAALDRIATCKESLLANGQARLAVEVMCVQLGALSGPHLG